jgi:hypothetical protein
MERYLNNFKKIRRIQKYMISSALIRGVPSIAHLDLDATLSQIIDHVIAQALKTVERRAEAQGGRRRLLDKAAGASDSHAAPSGGTGGKGPARP